MLVKAQQERAAKEKEREDELQKRSMAERQRKLLNESNRKVNSIVLVAFNTRIFTNYVYVH
jgi:hypothetical protein